MDRRKILASAFLTVSLVGTLTWTAFAAKASGNSIVNTSAKNYALLSETTDDSESEAKSNSSRKEKSFGFGFGMGIDSDTICEILGMTKEELSQKLKDNDGNILKILEESGKLEEYKAAALAKYKEQLDKSVSGGKITQEKADEMYSDAKEAITNFDGSPGSRISMWIGGKDGSAEMPSLDDIPEEMKNKIEEFKNNLGDASEKIKRTMGVVDIDVICEMLGLTKEELNQKLQDNDGNIYKILEEAGKLEEYKTTVLAKYKTDLDAKVSDGKITQEKADEMYNAMKESIENFDGSFMINFRTEMDEIGDKIREKFQRGSKGTRSDAGASGIDI